MTWLILFLFIIIPTYLIIFSIGELKNEIRRTNKKLNLIAEHFGVEDLEFKKEMSIIKELAIKGQKVEAIKRYRILTGEELKEAKEFIDKLIE